MRTLAPLLGLSAAVLVVSAGPVTAGGEGRTSASADRAVMVCGTDTATRRAWTREHGAAPVFVTAREALAIRPSDPAWDAPRCMTAREHARYRDAINQNAANRGGLHE